MGHLRGPAIGVMRRMRSSIVWVAAVVMVSLRPSGEMLGVTKVPKGDPAATSSCSSRRILVLHPSRSVPVMVPLVKRRAGKTSLPNRYGRGGASAKRRDELSPTSNADLVEDRLQVVLNRVLADLQGVDDRSRRQTPKHERRHPTLRRRETARCQQQRGASGRARGREGDDNRTVRPSHSCGRRTRR